MRITVKPVGPTFQTLVREVERDLRTANRKAGREIAKAGVKAINKGAPSMWGRRLATKADVTADTSDRVTVLFFPAPRNAGGWAMRESGTRPHDIYPRKRRRGGSGRPPALLFSGVYSANVDHPGSSGERAWTRAGERLEPAVTKVVQDIYDKALTSGG